jgi:uncharacterized protein (TIGR04255 family)
MDEGLPPREHFAEPPLVEFVLEFQLDVGRGGALPGSEGLSLADAGAPADDLAAFRSFYEAVRDYFPVAERVETTNLVLNLRVDADPLGSEGPPVAVSPEALQKAMQEATRHSTVLHRFGRKDRGMVLTVGPDLLGLSVLPREIDSGYPGWEVVRDLALRLLQIHRSLWRTGALRQIGMRYINIISVEPDKFRLRDYVEEVPGLVPPQLFEERNPFSLELTHALEVSADSVHEQSINLSAGPAKEPSPFNGELVLSIDERFMSLNDAEIGNAGDACDILHEAAYQVFMELLAPDVRSTFKPQPHKELKPI